MNPKTVKLLLIEDNLKEARLLREMLAQESSCAFEVTHMEKLATALQHLSQNSTDIILLDLSLPDSTGLTTFLKLQSHAEEIPIVVLTGSDDENLAVQTVQQGAQDYLVKGPFNDLILARSIRYAIERKRIEKELKKTRDLALENSRLKSEFLTNINHEIRTPMNGILGITELLQKTNLTSEQYESVQMVQSNAETLMIIINNMLDISAIDNGELLLENMNFDLSQILQEVLAAMLPRAIGQKIQLEAFTDPGVPSRLHGDPVRLRQVLTNLVDNGIKFTPKGGVTVRIRVIDETSSGVTLRFEVQDTGIGIPEESRPNLFQTFSQADGSSTRKYGGTGLGLAICKRLVEQMGGKIGNESAAGKGSTFWFTLRLDKATTEDKASQKNYPTPIPHPTIFPTKKTAGFSSACRILLVEDNAFNQKVAIRQIENFGYEVQVAANGLEALTALDSTTYDAILMDCQMPVMDGYEATAEIRRREADAHHTPIIALTAHALKGDREKCLTAGMDDYLSKPAKPEDLKRILERWLPKQPPPTPKIPSAALPPDKPSLPSTPPVEMDRLEEITEGDEAALLDLVKLYLTQTSEHIDRLVAAVQNGVVVEVHRIAHKCAGSSATCGVNSLVPSLRELERMGREGQLNGAQPLAEEVVRQFAAVRTFFSKRFPTLPPVS